LSVKAAGQNLGGAEPARSWAAVQVKRVLERAR